MIYCRLNSERVSNLYFVVGGNSARDRLCTGQECYFNPVSTDSVLRVWRRIRAG
jgi:hypothetical protein